MEIMQKFWQEVLVVWQHGAFGVDVSKWVTAFGLFILFLVFRNLITRLILNKLRLISSKTKTGIDDRVVDAVREPVRFIPVIMGLFAAFHSLSLDGASAEMSQSLVRSLIAFTLFWAFYRSSFVLEHLMKKMNKIFTPIMVSFVIKALKVLIVILGVAVILELWGIAVGPLVAGLGLFGVAVALGAQDLFKNLISGILIIAERRFNQGDWIRVDGVVEGTVEDIGFRSTLVRRFDKAPVHVPNAKLSDAPVTNFSAMTHRRIYWHLGVTYNTSIDQLKQIRDEIEAYIIKSDAFESPDKVSTFVRIDRFSDSSIDFMLYCFTKTTNWGEWLEIKEQLACEIKKIVEGAGSSFAFPSQSLYIEQMPGEQPEVFIPPKTAK